MRKTSKLVALVALVALSLLSTPIALLARGPADEETIARAFDGVRTYEPGEPRESVILIEAAVLRASVDATRRRSLARKSVGILTDAGATIAARRLACRWLGILGSAEDVAPLRGALADEALVESARQALERIPGDESLAALRGALTTAKGRARVGVVSSLGRRRACAAVGDLAALSRSVDVDLASAALAALGEIGTQEVAAVLGGWLVEDAATDRRRIWFDARARCAERLALDGDIDAAAAIHADAWRRGVTTLERISGLAGLVSLGGERAVTAVAEALVAEDGVVALTAVELARLVPGSDMTTVLTRQLDLTRGEPRLAILRVLAARRAAAARAPVLALLDSEVEGERVAAAEALGVLGDESCLAPLLHVAATSSGELQEAARQSLTLLAGDEVEVLLVEAAASPEPTAGEAVRTLASRGAGAALDAARRAVSASTGDARAAGLEVLAALGDRGDYAALVERIASTSDDEERKLSTHAAGVLGRRLALDDRVAPLAPRLDGADPRGRLALLALLPLLGGPQALELALRLVRDESEELARAAREVVIDWPDSSALAAVREIWERSRDAVERREALDGLLRLEELSSDPVGLRAERLSAALRLARGAEEKRLVLESLAGAPGTVSLSAALAEIVDEGVQVAAIDAVLRIAAPLARAERGVVVPAMEAILAMRPGEGLEKRAGEILARARSEVDCLDPPPYGSESIDARRRRVASEAGSGRRLIAYLDAGVQGADPEASGVGMRMTRGAPFQWAGAEAVDGASAATVAFDADRVEVEIAGLSPRGRYELVVRWWDFDNRQRRQSLVATAGDPERAVVLVPARRLPDHAHKREPAEEVRAQLPASVLATGRVRVAIRREGASNAVVSEIWLLEEAAVSQTQEPSVGKGPAREARVVIVTGIDYPGHRWKETTPVLTGALLEEPALAVRVVEDPAFLASPELERFDVVVLHFMNWERPDPGPAAREGLRRFVASGKGLVLVHFACGAFQEWPEFGRLAGRVWDPKLRGHDPYGRFRVQLTAEGRLHPATRGLEDFDTVDELYTCLAGDARVEVLATARSKVDGKDYPMAFVLEYGEGRVFHSPLGHDVRALSSRGTQALFRRGVRWAAGLESRSEP